MNPKILVMTTKGHGTNDEDRIVTLVGNHECLLYPYERKRRWLNFFKIIWWVLIKKIDLIIMEGTGIPGGAALLFCKTFFGTKYIYSSGDAVGPYLARRYPWASFFFHAYERTLTTHCDAFVGWTPFFVERALAMGAPRSISCAGWFKPKTSKVSAQKLKEEIGIPSEKIVVGILGSLNWDAQRKYCYGLEIIEAIKRTKNKDIVGLIVGDGSGLKELKERAGDHIYFTGRVNYDEVGDYYQLFDYGSLPQSLDEVGKYRYSTKFAQYCAMGIPIIMGPLPMTHHFPKDWFHIVHAHFPWSEEYFEKMAKIFDEIKKPSQKIEMKHIELDVLDQVHRFSALINTTLNS